MIGIRNHLGIVFIIKFFASCSIFPIIPRHATKNKMMIDEDVWSIIIQFLDIQTITSLLATCTTFNTLFKHNHIWDSLIQRDFQQWKNHYIQSLYSSSSPIEIYKYYYQIIIAFPYLLIPPEEHVEFPTKQFVQTNVIIISTKSPIMYLLLNLFSHKTWDNTPRIGVELQVLKLLPKKENDTMNRSHKIIWFICDALDRLIHRGIPPSFYRLANSFITGFDIADPENRMETELGKDSLSDALYWATQIKGNKGETTTIYCIGIGISGNEFTSPHVSQQDIINYCRERNMHYFEIRKETYTTDIIYVLNSIHRFRMESNPPDYQPFYVTSSDNQSPSNRSCIIN
jgi:hypothetical protein